MALPISTKPIPKAKVTTFDSIPGTTSFEREESEDVAISQAGDQIVEEPEALKFTDAALVAYPIETKGENYALWFIALAFLSAGIGVLIFRKVPPHPAIG